MGRYSMAGAVLVFSIASPGRAGAQARPFPDPTGFWSFDMCSSETWDSAVSPHHATLGGGVHCAAGQYGDAAWFDGTGLVEVPGSSNLNPEHFTVSAWVKPADDTARGAVVNRWYAMDAWGIWFDAGSYMFAVSFPDGSWGTPVGVSAPGAAGQWTHVAGVYDGQNVILYLDGVEVRRTPASGTPQVSDRPIAIGNHPAWDGFRGAIDEVRFYDRALDPADIALLAIPPSPLGNRGLHLYPDKLACGSTQGFFPCRAGDEPHDKFRHDLDIIHSTGNLNSVKTTIFSYIGDDGQAAKRDTQNEKLSYLASATGGSKTWIVRAWATPNDCAAPVASYEACGTAFAQALAPALTRLRDLHLPYVYLEVANEPNWPHADGVDFIGSDPRNSIANMDHYNDFFRGFYFGQQAIGFNFGLVYAGLAPDCSAGGCAALDWYRYFWVRKHIADYAAKIGVHVYWDSTDQSAWNSRTSPLAGRMYRTVHDILADPSPSVYPVPARGIQITEFGFNKQNVAVNAFAVQADEDCEWWKSAGADAGAYWVEQATRYITSANFNNGNNDSAAYWMDDSQIASLRDCRP